MDSCGLVLQMDFQEWIPVNKYLKIILLQMVFPAMNLIEMPIIGGKTATFILVDTMVLSVLGPSTFKVIKRGHQ
ncbi:hypothetical protein D3C87_1937920 [compost metagenome]